MMLILSIMKKGFLHGLGFRNLSFLVLILVLVLSPCGIKQSLKQIFKVENLSSHNVKANASCQYVAASEAKVYQQNIRKTDFKSTSGQFYLDQGINVNSCDNSFAKPRSVPLYILYQQLRLAIV